MTGKRVRNLQTEISEKPGDSGLNSFSRVATGIRDLKERQAAPPSVIPPAMIHEMMAHLPFVVTARGNSAKWEWMAEYLTNALREPDKPCPCCGVTPLGEYLASDEEAHGPLPATNDRSANVTELRETQPALTGRVFVEYMAPSLAGAIARTRKKDESGH